jgi:hypothetical protein
MTRFHVFNATDRRLVLAANGLPALFDTEAQALNLAALAAQYGKDYQVQAVTVLYPRERKGFAKNPGAADPERVYR